ncbi:asparagine synthetase B family protein [Streptomyces sp. BE133]|uniref:asparagine synthetase B family protein n=1 Tax=Streptomyces sp. BE133 TaxID=3002523 RepID=UPI002E7AA915|nr:asparagine synthase C-terminal domain-containing protein [Streptomyces sp. BE133]MEE1806636.1 asparagine synthase C-terminal domain-containing protein [Streptomyces sp. BE133]
MARFCVCLAPTTRQARSHVEAMGAAGTGQAAMDVAGADLGLIAGEPGRAEGPFTAYGLTAVGEVTLHNRPALLSALHAEGTPIPARCSDGELLLHCWARLGDAGVALAEGMFVLAVLDGTDLILIRDHAGARTLFYARAEGAWTASTSLRALRRWPALGTSMNLSAVRSFLTFAYLPGEETLLTGVREVLPGRVLRLAQDGTVTEAVHWEPREHIAQPVPQDPTEHILALRALLERATADRLPEAEPAAVLLSGGIDSSLVTALAAKLHSHPVHTYSISFGDELPNELGYSGLVAAHCHTRHRVLNVSGKTVASRLAEAAALLDSPVGDPLTVPNLLLAETVAADGASVVLNGEGGDPVFGGPKNLPMLVQEMHREPGAPWDEDRATAYLRSYRKCWTDLPTLLTAQTLDALRDAPRPQRFVEPYLTPGADSPHRMGHLLNQLLHCNLRTKGAHHILTKVERLTASQGIEGRAPLFDRRVVDHAFATPPTYKLRGSAEKWILKEAVRDLLPDTVVDRPKSGMRVPVQQWLTGPLRDLGNDLLLSRQSAGRGLFRPDTVRTWMKGEGMLLPRQGGKLWLVLTLELWLRSYAL